ncbi:MAG: hypothetical protein JO168_22790 [Solirubrobacterales bacterium]|nr:hypothetical protein [Solirubrobacterales bacterium]
MRYGAVFVVVLTQLLFQVLAPDASWARAVAVGLAAGALMVAVATSRATSSVRRFRTVLVGLLAVIAVGGIASGAFSATVAFAIGTLFLAATPVVIVGALFRLTMKQGVTAQVVAGALAIYLLIGLLFASALNVAAHVEGGSFFSGSGTVTNGDRVYYSFTVLTTTGFGDYTTTRPVGHALAVLEMLTGQLYLVTVIGILIGNFAGRRIERGHSKPLSDRRE